MCPLLCLPTLGGSNLLSPAEPQTKRWTSAPPTCPQKSLRVALAHSFCSSLAPAETSCLIRSLITTAGTEGVRAGVLRVSR